jgi:hypothetical protein
LTVVCGERRRFAARGVEGSRPRLRPPVALGSFLDVRECEEVEHAVALGAGENLFLIDPNHDPEPPDRLVRKTPRFGIVEVTPPDV